MEVEAKSKTGIVDKHQKMKAMMDTFAQDTRKGVLAAGLGERRKADIYSLQEAYKKWDKSKPGPWLFVIENWCDELFRSRSPETVRFFMDSTVAAFEARIQEVARQIQAEYPDSDDWILENHHGLQAIDQDEQQHTVRSSLRSRRLDQRLYYMNVDSAQAWSDLINVGEYLQYELCRDSLRVFLRDVQWTQRIAGGEFGAIVMLGGGGSASKDVEILRSLKAERTATATDQPVRYILLDVSQHMLTMSISRIKRFFRRNPVIRPRARVEGLLADMCNLRAPELGLLRTPGRRNAWFLTGGTIGNLSERNFFESLNSVAKPGDILLIGVDTFDPQHRAAWEQEIKSKYAPEAMQEFLATPIGMLLHQAQSNESVRKLRGNILIDVVDGHSFGYSDIDDTLTAQVRLALSANDEYVLLTSTRYRLDVFKQWCATRKWQPLATYAPPEAGAGFRQVLLERSQ